MRRTRLHCRRTSAAEHGFTLIELTITVALLVLVLGMFFEALASSQRSESFAEDRSQTLDALQVTMARVTKDTRQATSIDPASSASLLNMQTYVAGALATVVYQINGTMLTRSVNGGAALVLIRNLASPSLFTYEPSSTNAQVVTILLQATPKHSPNTTVQLTSEVRLRNLSNS
jgi:prepilin-type N-terminal cleavage/methylation domain-containing protein